MWCHAALSARVRAVETVRSAIVLRLSDYSSDLAGGFDKYCKSDEIMRRAVQYLHPFFGLHDSNQVIVYSRGKSGVNA